MAVCNSANGVKVVVRHVWVRAKERVNARRLTEWGKRMYTQRKETVERSFAGAKQLHGHRYVKMRGLRKLAEQCLLGLRVRAYVLMRHFLLRGAFLCRSPVFSVAAQFGA
ncbi:transposase [Collimonas humicola]